MTQSQPPLRGPRFYQAGTDAVPARERFDYWHSLFAGADLAPLGARADYHARLAGCDGDDGVIFTDMSCAPTAAAYAGQDINHLRISIVTHGVLHVSDDKDNRTVFRPGHQLALFDASRAGKVDSPSGYRALHLTLPRPLVLAALGENPTGGALLRSHLPASPLGQMLGMQLEMIACHGPCMNAREISGAMQAVSALVTTYLGQLREHDDDPLPDTALFTSASALIDRWKEDPTLTVERVAHALGCSRASLFRLFERQGIGIGAHIRETRLAHGKHLLRDTSLDIGEVALRTGYADASAFGKAFRHRYGLSPRDWRAALP